MCRRSNESINPTQADPPTVLSCIITTHNTEHKAKEPEKALDWEFCGYDAPFIPGPLRRNEVWVDLKMEEEQIKQKLAQVDAAAAAAAEEGAAASK